MSPGGGEERGAGKGLTRKVRHRYGVSDPQFRRSLKLNDEASLNIYNTAFAGEMTRAFEEDLARSEPYTWEAWRARPLRERISEQLMRPFRSQL